MCIRELLWFQKFQDVLRKALNTEQVEKLMKISALEEKKVN